MPRYLVERTFPQGLEKIVDTNGALGVTCVHSSVSPDKAKTYGIYDAPNPEAIREAGSRNHVPVDAITEVSVLDPYCYK